jgi:hypothetical protein
MQIIITQRFYLTPVRIATIKTTNVGEDAGEKGTLILSLWEGKLIEPPWKTP